MYTVTLLKTGSTPGRPAAFKVLTKFTGRSPRLPIVGERFHMSMEPDGDHSPVYFQSSVVERILSQTGDCVRFVTSNSVYKLTYVRP